MNTEKKVLFHVYSAGRKLEGEFGSKMAAKRFRDKHNASKSYGKDDSRAWWVGVGRDHWRWNTDLRIPTRPKEDVEAWIAEEPVEALKAA